MKISRYLAIQCLLALCLHVFAADFTNFHLDGAPTIGSFAQDPDGLLWIGAGNGLYSFDGYHYYTHVDPSGKANTFINDILSIDRMLYLATENGIFSFNTITDKFTLLSDPKVREVRALYLQGNYILAGAGSGLYRLKKGGGSCRLVALEGHAVYSILESPLGILVGTLDGLYLIKNSGQAQKLVLPLSRQPLINSLFYDNARKCFWIGAEGNLFQWDLHTFKPISAFRGKSIKTMVASRLGDLLVGTDVGLYNYAVDGSIWHYSHQIGNEGSLTNNIVWSLFLDKWKNVWIATDNGVSMMQGANWSTTVSLMQLTKSLNGNVLHALYRQPSGFLWLGGTNGLICWNERTGDSRWFSPDNPKNWFSHNRARRIYEDSDGDIWVPSDHGLNYYGRKKGGFISYIVTDKTGRYNTNWCYDVLMDNQKRLWIAAYNGGIFIIDKQRLLASSGYCIADEHIRDGKNGLCGIHIGQLNVDGEGNVWAMSYGHGLDRINPKTLEVKHVFKNTYITYTTVDEQGQLWAGFKGGVALMPKGGGKPKIHRFNDGIYPEFVSTMIAANGNLWVFSDKVCRVIRPSKSDLHLRIPIPGICVFYSKEQQRILVGSSDNLLYISPSAIDHLDTETHPKLVSMLVNGKEYSSSDGNILADAEIILSSKENNLSFRFTDFPFTPFPKSIYMYKLEGNDDQWHYINDFHEAITFNALSPGHYTMVVRSVDDPKEERACRLEFTIHHPWYSSWWAFFIYLAIIMGIIWAVMHFYAMKKTLLHERVARKRLLEQSQARSHFFARLSSKLKMSMSKIILPIEKLYVDGADSASVHQIWNNVAHMNKMIYDSLDTDGENIELSTEGNKGNVNIVAFLQLEAERYNSTEHKANVKLSTEMEYLFKEVDPARFGVVISVLLDNVSKQGGETDMILKRDKEHEAFTITVSNENFHLSEQERNMIFQRYPIGTEFKGGGLYLIQKYVEDSHGTLVINEKDDFVIAYPLKVQAMLSLDEVKPQLDKLFLEATNLIEEHISDSSFNVTSLQVALGVGDKLLYRKIKAITGMSPVEYIRSIRLKKAAMLLREGKFSVTEVMFMVGFSNSGYFSKMFQRAFGVTPKDFASNS